FNDIPHDIDLQRKIYYSGLRPSIPKYVPKLVFKLIVKCWNAQPDKRPTAKEICDTINSWNNDKSSEIIAQIMKADETFENLLISDALEPSHFKINPEAIYRSRLFDSLSSTNITADRNGNQGEQENNSLLIMQVIENDKDSGLSYADECYLNETGEAKIKLNI
ncbi:5433_t:CDS:2, partial [Racocetra fulgida]